MSNGIKIAKTGETIKSNLAGLYVDTDTPLLKVYKHIEGSVYFNGSSYTAQWNGDYQGKYDGNGFYSLHVPHILGYVPTFIPYMDLNAGSDRAYLTSSSAGIVTEQDISAAAFANEKEIWVQFNSNISDVNGNILPPPIGAYGYSIYVYYDELKVVN